MVFYSMAVCVGAHWYTSSHTYIGSLLPTNGGTQVCTLFTVGQDDRVLYRGKLRVQDDSVEQRSEGSGGVQDDSSNS